MVLSGKNSHYQTGHARACAGVEERVGGEVAEYAATWFHIFLVASAKELLSSY